MMQVLFVLCCSSVVFGFLGQLSKTRTHKILFSVIAGNKVGYSQCPFLLQRPAVETSRQNYIHLLRKPGFYIYKNNSHQQKLTMKSTLHTSVPMSNNTEDTKWIRTVTINQSSKNDQNKIITFDISVLDTHSDDLDNKRRTVVAIHGFPGSGYDFASLATKLYEKGIRMVAPTSLGMTHSPITSDQLNDIEFSTEARTKSLQLILETMNIHRIDMLIGHSAGAWTMYKAGASWENIGSLFGINPGGAEPNRTLRPYFLTRFAAAALLWSLGRLIMLPFIAQVYARLGFKGITTNGNGLHLVATQQYIAHQAFPDVLVNAEKVRRRQLPFLMAYSLNDKIVEPILCSNMACNVLRIPEQNIVTYTDDKTPSKDPCFVPEGWLSRCLVFARGGHIVHVAHEKEIVEQIENVLELIAMVKNTKDMFLVKK